MIITVDSNIVFSALLNSNSVIGDLLLNSQNLLVFNSCSYLFYEIDKHWDKLISLSKLSELELRESQRIIYKEIDFFDEQQLPKKFRLIAYDLVKDIDLNDIAFLTLNEFQNSILWTGDKQLTKGLKAKNYTRIVNTSELDSIRRELKFRKDI